MRLALVILLSFPFIAEFASASVNLPTTSGTYTGSGTLTANDGSTSSYDIKISFDTKNGNITSVYSYPNGQTCTYSFDLTMDANGFFTATDHGVSAASGFCGTSSCQVTSNYQNTCGYSSWDATYTFVGNELFRSGKYVGGNSPYLQVLEDHSIRQ
jgi:hypothetical protein